MITIDIFGPEVEEPQKKKEIEAPKPRKNIPYVTETLQEHPPDVLKRLV